MSEVEQFLQGLEVIPKQKNKERFFNCCLFKVDSRGNKLASFNILKDFFGDGTTIVRQSEMLDMEPSREKSQPAQTSSMLQRPEH